MYLADDETIRLAGFPHICIVCVRPRNPLV